MKLLQCFSCHDLFPLRYEYRECACKTVSGNYRDDGLHADVWMPTRMSGVVLGFANSSYTYAVHEQIVKGDSTETMWYGGRQEVKGRDFVAFVIPEAAPTVHRHYNE